MFLLDMVQGEVNPQLDQPNHYLHSHFFHEEEEVYDDDEPPENMQQDEKCPIFLLTKEDKQCIRRPWRSSLYFQDVWW